jgi:hypothetical protein
MIIVGGDGVGKSHFLRSMMWFGNQHGWADSTIVTSYQGRLVSNLRNHVVRIYLQVEEIELYPLQKGMLKDIISLVGCNSPVVVVVSMGGLKWRMHEV